jgi:hypothetical protein
MPSSSPAEGDVMAESDRPVTAAELREQLAAYPTREEFKAELKAALEPYATKEDLKAMRDELRAHFDAARESFRDEFKWLHEWVEANHKGVVNRVDALEQGHGGRLMALETRVTALEIDRSRR